MRLDAELRQRGMQRAAARPPWMQRRSLKTFRSDQRDAESLTRRRHGGIAIHDHEGFEGYSVSEYEGMEAVHDIAEFIAERPEFGSKLLEKLGDVESARKAAEENYCGCHHSLADYAQELTEETTEIPKSLRHYIDYESMARDMQLNGDVFTIETGYEEVHIFWCADAELDAGRRLTRRPFACHRLDSRGAVAAADESCAVLLPRNPCKDLS